MQPLLLIRFDHDSYANPAGKRWISVTHWAFQSKINKILLKKYSSVFVMGYRKTSETNVNLIWFPIEHQLTYKPLPHGEIYGDVFHHHWSLTWYSNRVQSEGQNTVWTQLCAFRERSWRYHKLAKTWPSKGDNHLTLCLSVGFLLLLLLNNSHIYQ